MEAKIFKVTKAVSYLCIIYGLIVLFLIGPFHIFNFFYLLIGIILFLLCRYRVSIRKKIGMKACRILNGLILTFVTVFLLFEIWIVSFSLRPCVRDADHLIVLGSYISETGPSMDYKARLDSAYAYLMENEKTIAITTGAKGPNEPVSEGEGGRRYLIEKGIKEDRILAETESYNTVENIANAKKLIGKDADQNRIVIVSADYHLFRAYYLAKLAGFQNVSCKGGHGLFALLPQYYTREFFAFVKELLFTRSV